MSTVTISLTISGVAGGSFGDLTTTFEISGADGDRLLAYVVAEHGSGRTPQQAVDAMAEVWFKSLLAQTVRHEKEQAAKAAAEAKASISYQRGE